MRGDDKRGGDKSGEVRGGWGVFKAWHEGYLSHELYVSGRKVLGQHKGG